MRRVAVDGIVEQEFQAARMRIAASILAQDSSTEFLVIVASMAKHALQLGRRMEALAAALRDSAEVERTVREVLDLEPGASQSLQARILELATLYRLGEMR